MAESPQIAPKQSGGYGKRPIWHWIVLYIILGVIVYGLIYFFFMRDSGSSGGGGGGYGY